jgi:acetate kinase
MKILVANLGSTSLKMKLLEMESEALLAEFHLGQIGSSHAPMYYWAEGRETPESQVHAPSYEGALQYALDMLIDEDHGPLTNLSDIDGIGFKAVHAGDFYGPALVNDEVINQMKRYNQAAPSHNPIYIDAMLFLKQLLPDVPQVAVFETAFHRTLPDYAWIYSTPYAWYQKYGVRRYGFHSASFRYLAERVPELLGKASTELRFVACHLGGSSSVCAIKNGASIDTSMGFTPQAGVPMSSRSGDFDPFVIPFIMGEEDMTPIELSEQLSKHSGLLGISGISGDVRKIESAAHEGNPRARLALDAYTYAVKKYIGAYAAAMGGLDALVFSGGIGENSPTMRARICRDLEFLGIMVNRSRNEACKGLETVISTETAPIPVWVVPTNEEIIVARETQWLLQMSPDTVKE